MSRCGCSDHPEDCLCSLSAGVNAEVSGAGSSGDPFIFSGAPLIRDDLDAIQADTSIDIEGTLAWAADTQRVYQFDGSAWQLVWAISPPRCSLRKQADQSIPHNTPTMVTFGAEDADTDGMHSNAALTERITIQTAGVYDIGFAVLWAIGDDLDSYRAGRILLNGTAERLTRDNRMEMGVISCVNHGERSGIEFAQGDYIELEVQQTDGGAIDVLFEQNVGLRDGTRMWAVWRSAA